MSPSETNWQPTASIDILKRRADFLRDVREFFYARNVIEVEVPLLASHGVTDPYNENICCDFFGENYYLQTSPEYHLKRLLCAGAPDLYQLSKAFRHEQSGFYHNPEFTLLEWYRLNWCYKELFEEVITLITSLLNVNNIRRLSYKELFQTYCQFDPFIIGTKTLQSLLQDKVPGTAEMHLDRDGWLALAMGYIIEPRLKLEQGLFIVYDYPKTQASLAVIDGDYAKRFEVYLEGVELANGFEELSDPQEQLRRFEQDNLQRKQQGKPQVKIDKRFLAALGHGLPPCSGVALGLDRLFMAKYKLSNIALGLSFSTKFA